MNKKTIKIAGWALGLSMAVAGIGVAVGATYAVNGNEPMMVRASSETTEVVTSDLTNSTEVKKWSCTDGGTYADNSRKLSATGNNVLRNNLFSGSVSTGMTSLTVTVNGKINGTDSASNKFTVEAIDSTGATLASTVYTGTIGTTYSDHVFTITSASLSGTTGIKISYTKSSGNWGIKTVKWQATYSSTDPIVNWESGAHPSEGYTDVAYDFSAVATNITDPAWTWSVSPSVGTTVTNVDELAEITFSTTGTYVVTAYAEAKENSSVHAQVQQEIEIAASSSTLSLSESSIKLGLGKSATVTPTVTNHGSFTDTQVTVNIESGADLITVTGLSEGAVESGNGITIASKSKEGVATIAFTNNGNTERLTVEIAATSTIVYAFSDKELNFSSAGSDDIASYTGASWTATANSVNQFESNQNARGVQIGAAKGDVNVTLSADAEMKKYSITKVVVVVSSNGTGNTLGVNVGGVTFKSGANTAVSTNSMTNTAVTFDGNGCGDLVIAISDTNKSVYIKSVTITIESNANAVQRFVDNYMWMDEYKDDNSYLESRCVANWASASAAYDKLNSTQQALFVGGDYADAAERFGWWAAANGATFNASTGVLAANSSSMLNNVTTASSGVTFAVSIFVATGVLAAGGFAFLRRKKEDR